MTEQELKEQLINSYKLKNIYIVGYVDNGCDQTYINHFQGYLSCSGQFKIEWYSKNDYNMNGGMVYGDNNAEFFISRFGGELDQLETEKCESGMGIAGATGISSGSAHLLRELQLGNINSVLNENIDSIELVDDCYKVRTRTADWSFSELTLKDGLIQEIKSMFYQSRHPEYEEPEFSEEYITSLLGDAVEITPENIEHHISMFKEAHKKSEKLFTLTVFSEQKQIDGFVYNDEKFELWDRIQ